MTGSSAYRLRDVAKSYGGVTVLEIDALDASVGDVLCLLGPTGAGKSTLLRLFAGLERPDRGEIGFGGAELEAPDLALDVRRRIAMVHQRPCLLSGSVRRNVEYGLRIRRDLQRSAKAQAILARLGIEGLAGQSAQTLSGGQAQLVALARALVLETDALLLDEPTAHLDPANVARAEAAIRERASDGRTTIVWATHNLFQARRVARRIALLWDGKLIEVAPAETFFQSPVDPRARDFVEGRAVY